MLLTDGQGVIAQAPIEGCCTRATCSTPSAPMRRRSYAKATAETATGRRELARARARGARACHCRRCRRSCCASCTSSRARPVGWLSALVRPLLWAGGVRRGFRNVFGVAIVEPYDTYIPYDVYIVPGLVGMVLLFKRHAFVAGDGLTTARWA
jgi:hypothetical protein